MVKLNLGPELMPNGRPDCKKKDRRSQGKGGDNWLNMETWFHTMFSRGRGEKRKKYRKRKKQNEPTEKV